MARQTSQNTAKEGCRLGPKNHIDHRATSKNIQKFLPQSTIHPCPLVEETDKKNLSGPWQTKNNVPIVNHPHSQPPNHSIRKIAQTPVRANNSMLSFRDIPPVFDNPEANISALSPIAHARFRYPGKKKERMIKIYIQCNAKLKRWMIPR